MDVAAQETAEEKVEAPMWGAGEANLGQDASPVIRISATFPVLADLKYHDTSGLKRYLCGGVLKILRGSSLPFSQTQWPPPRG